MIGSAVAAALPLMREHAESLMTDVCSIERLTTTWDEVNQKSVTTWATVHADVPCHVEEPSVTGAAMLTGESVTLETPLAKIPHTYDDVRPDDRVTVTGRDPIFVTRAAHDDLTHPVEMVLACRRTR